MRRVTLPAVGLALLVGLTAAGCSSNGGEQPIVVVATKNAGALNDLPADDAPLRISKLGCVTMGPYTLVVPPGSTFDGRTIRIPGHSDLTIGHKTGIRRTWQVENTAGTRTFLAEDAERCGDADYAWLFPFG